MLHDGRLASGGVRAIRLWDPKTGRETTRLELHKSWVGAFAVLPDGRLVSGSWDKTIRIWDPKTEQETTRLEGHDDRVAALAVLGEQRLASGSWDKTIRLWDLNTGREITRLELDSPIGALAVLPSSKLVAGDGLGRINWLDIIT